MVIENLVFDGAGSSCFIKYDGAGTFVLGSGAVIQNMAAPGNMALSPIHLMNGTHLYVREGAAVRNNTIGASNYSGGAIFLGMNVEAYILRAASLATTPHLNMVACSV